MYCDTEQINGKNLSELNKKFDEAQKKFDSLRENLSSDTSKERRELEKQRAHRIAWEKRHFLIEFGKIGRNHVCPCNSGKKWKKCHGA